MNTNLVFCLYVEYVRIFYLIVELIYSLYMGVWGPFFKIFFQSGLFYNMNNEFVPLEDLLSILTN